MKSIKIDNYKYAKGLFFRSAKEAEDEAKRVKVRYMHTH